MRITLLPSPSHLPLAVALIMVVSMAMPGAASSLSWPQPGKQDNLHLLPQTGAFGPGGTESLALDLRRPVMGSRLLALATSAAEDEQTAQVPDDYDPDTDPYLPSLDHPESGGWRFATDILITNAAVFGWKRALNVTAARRIFIQNYDNFEDFITTPPPIDDGNNWTTNWVAHPMLGAYAYMYFRSRGHSRFLSSVGTFIMSTVHEYLIESSFEPASGIDLILTPALGVPLGMVADELSVRWVRSDSSARRFFSYVINPMIAMPWSRWRRSVNYDPSRDTVEIGLSMPF